MSLACSGGGSCELPPPSNRSSTLGPQPRVSDAAATSRTAAARPLGALLGANSRHVRALAYLVSYPRHPAIPMLAATVLAHVTQSDAMPGAVDMLFPTVPSAAALVGNVARALTSELGSLRSDTLAGAHLPWAQSSRPVRPHRSRARGAAGRAAWVPSLQVDFVYDELAYLVELAGKTAVEPLEGAPVQLALLDMLLAPLRAGHDPSLTLAFLGLDRTEKRLTCSALLGAVVAIVVHAAEWPSVAATAMELLYRLGVDAQRAGQLDDLLAALHRLLPASLHPSRGAWYFYRAPPALPEGVDWSARRALASVGAWRLRLASLALCRACDPSSPSHAQIGEMVRDHLDNLGAPEPLLAPPLAVGGEFDPVLEAPWEVPGPWRAAEAAAKRRGRLHLLDFAAQISGLPLEEQVRAKSWAAWRNQCQSASEANRNRLRGWEELLEVCVSRAPLVSPHCRATAEQLSGLLQHSARTLSDDPDLEVSVPRAHMPHRF
jgi:hypothetical protein